MNHKDPLKFVPSVKEIVDLAEGFVSGMKSEKDIFSKYNTLKKVPYQFDSRSRLSD